MDKCVQEVGDNIYSCHWYVAIIGWLEEFMSIYFGTVNPLGHWIWISFGTRLHITLMRLSSLWGIGLRIPLRGLYGFRVTPGMVAPSHLIPVPVLRFLEFSMPFVVGFKYLGLIVLWWHIGCFFRHNLQSFSFPLSTVCGNYFIILCLLPNKAHVY